LGRAFGWNEKDGWYALDSEPGGKILFNLRIYFIKLNSSFVFMRQFIHDWRDHPAGTTPIRVEVNDAGKISRITPRTMIFKIENLLLETLCSQLLNHSEPSPTETSTS
jgi:hypothetical protein